MTDGDKLMVTAEAKRERDLLAEVERLTRERDEARKDLAIAQNEIAARDGGDPFGGLHSEDAAVARLMHHFEVWALMTDAVESDAISEADLAARARLLLKERACSTANMRKAYDVNLLRAKLQRAEAVVAAATVLENDGDLCPTYGSDRKLLDALADYRSQP